MNVDAVRDLALALPEAVEQDHHGMASFRVRGKVFATVPDERHVRLVLAEEETREALEPEVTELFWGTKTSGVVVDLDVVDPVRVAELVTDAWRGKAPSALRTLR